MIREQTLSLATAFLSTITTIEPAGQGTPGPQPMSPVEPVGRITWLLTIFTLRLFPAVYPSASMSMPRAFGTSRMMLPSIVNAPCVPPFNATRIPSPKKEPELNTPAVPMLLLRTMAVIVPPVFDVPLKKFSATLC